MIILDKTSFLALVTNVPGSAIQRTIEELDDVPMLYVARDTLLEAMQAFVAEHGVENVERVSQRIIELDVVVLPGTAERQREAAAAFAQYGEGRLAGTNLTLGDCAAYALARRLSGLLVCETLAFGSLMDPFKELAASLR